ncbi:hypothetical protein EG487_20175 [Paenibacillus polymyxa]|nr:hypothetical protein EG487_20175 [Paenibacillus polymyxa]
MSVWIEIYLSYIGSRGCIVALHMRAWIEILSKFGSSTFRFVALHVSAWIEISSFVAAYSGCCCRTLYECVD